MAVQAQSRSDTSVVASGFKDRTRVAVPALSVAISQPPAVEVGQPVLFNLQITNNSEMPLTNVILKDTFNAGLAHKDGQTSPIQVLLGTLGPRETQNKQVTFIALQPGQLCHTLEVTADGGAVQVARGCVTANPSTRPLATPSVQATVRGPGQASLGE